MKKFAFTLSLATLILVGCATTPTNTLAIKKADQSYEVTGIGKTSLIAKNNAISAANKTCGARRVPVLINEHTEYQGALKGVVNEQTGKMIGAAADILGGITGTKTSISTDTDYQTTLNFTCQPNA